MFGDQSRLRNVPSGCTSRAAWHSIVLGIEIVRDGRFPSRGLLVSNHLSYLDILAFSAVSPAVFVSKKEVGAWPLYGWLARLAGTVSRRHKF